VAPITEPITYPIIKNYPNPFNPSTNIIFSIPSESAYNEISLEIYDISGKLVKNLMKEKLQQGTYIITWNGKDNSGKQAATGIYIANLCSGSLNKSVKMNLIK
jgi:flagellar hook assembly protein FlgD